MGYGSNEISPLLRGEAAKQHRSHRAERCRPPRGASSRSPGRAKLGEPVTARRPAACLGRLSVRPPARALHRTSTAAGTRDGVGGAAPSTGGRRAAEAPCCRAVGAARAALGAGGQSPPVPAGPAAPFPRPLGAARRGGARRAGGGARVGFRCAALISVVMEGRPRRAASQRRRGLAAAAER